MPTRAQYISTLERTDRIIKSRTDGLTHEDSLLQLPVPANCLNWVLGHLLVYREQILGLLDGASTPNPAEFALYGAGSEPITADAPALSLAEILARLDALSNDIKAAVRVVAPEKLAEVIDPEKGTMVEDRLFFYLVFHESYHVGQLEVLQELALAQR